VRCRPWLLIVLLALGCGSPPEDKPIDPTSWSHFQVPVPPAADPQLLHIGARIYASSCASCHGDTGAADGACASLQTPPPRDLTAGIFRFKSTPGGDLPTDEDLFRTISMGLRGTDMSPWRRVLSASERWAVTFYIKSLSPAFEQWGQGQPVDLGPEPAEISDERLQRGEDLYVAARCPQCHGETGAGDGPAASTLVDAFGNTIRPRNFRDADQFKRGTTLRDNALMIYIGNGGNSMPGFDAAFSPEQIWDLAGYVQSLSRPASSNEQESANALPGASSGATADVSVALTLSGGALTPAEVRVSQGQVVRISFEPTDNGNGTGHGLVIEGYEDVVALRRALVERPKTTTFSASRAGTFALYITPQCGDGTRQGAPVGAFVVEPADQTPAERVR